MQEWHEQDHPRDEDGKFTDKSGVVGTLDPRKIEYRQNTPYSVIMADDRRRMAEEERRTRKIPQPVVKRGEELAKIRELTGVDEETAKKYQATVFEWSTHPHDIRNGEDPEGERILEDYIARSSKYGGKVYRGIAFDERYGKEYLDGLKINKKAGVPIKMNGISSWSSEVYVAKAFALDGEIGFLFEEENESGAPVAFLSNYFGEEEVLHSKKTQYVVKSIEFCDVKSEKNKEHYYVYKVIVEEV